MRRGGAGRDRAGERKSCLERGGVRKCWRKKDREGWKTDGGRRRGRGMMGAGMGAHSVPD